MVTISACDTSGDRSAPAETNNVESVATVKTDATSTTAETDNLEKVSVMALGPADGRAVVSLTGGKMQVLMVGDTVPDTNAIVVQVLHDKLVVEETIEKAGDPPVKQMAWLYKSGKTGEKSRIQRLDQVGPDKEPLQAPVNTGVN